MSDDFTLILACRTSGQMSEAQWEEHKRDPLFALWLARKYQKETARVSHDD